MLNADWLGTPRLRSLRTIGARGIKTCSAFDASSHFQFLRPPNSGLKTIWQYKCVGKLFCTTSLFIKLIFVLFCSIFILMSWEKTVRYILDESAPAGAYRSCPFPSLPVVSLISYHWICCLFEATKQK